jgi:hypothetical protein
MNQKTIDIANIALMIISCVAAYLLPFELFLFSYAVLGPLHYLTEISWLHKRDYFTTGKFDYLIFIPLGVILTLFIVTNYQGPDAARWSTNLIFICVVSALGMVLLQNWFYKIIVIVSALVIGYALSGMNSMQLAFGMYLPTLVHVFIFTGLFIIYGALKSKSITGLVSVGVFILCGASFFIYHPAISWYHVSDYAQRSISGIRFDGLISSFAHMFNMDKDHGAFKSLEDFQHFVFHSTVGQSIMRFIAFAYTYHYLNWFSKTSVIKWHKVPAKWLAIVVVLWICSVGLYAYDYMMGLEVLFLLSMLHVFLEFPLNYRSIIGIGEELGLRVNLPKPAMAQVPVRPAPTPGKVRKVK